MRLYGFWRSSATWRVRIALELKGARYEVIPVNVTPAAREQQAPQYRARNPMAQVPTLEVPTGDGPREAIARGLAALEQHAAETAGTFLVGPSVSIADICLIPQLYNARRYQLPMEAYPRLCAVEAACEAMPAFAAAHPDRQPDAGAG